MKANQTFIYSDSEAGMQTKQFPTLSSIIEHIESFDYNGDSDGVVMEYGTNSEVIFYKSTKNGVIWIGIS